jgi:hypothetical protein
VRRPRNQLRCDSTRLKIKEEKKTENRAFLTARCHNEGRFSRDEPDAFSELDRGPLGGGAAPITANGATAGILSGPHAHPPEPAVSGTVNRAGPVTDRDTRRNFFLIPLDVS